MQQNQSEKQEQPQHPRDEPEDARKTGNVQVVCDLYNLAVMLKSQELRRLNPEASEQWLLNESLKLIERGCR